MPPSHLHPKGILIVFIFLIHHVPCEKSTGDHYKHKKLLSVKQRWVGVILCGNVVISTSSSSMTTTNLPKVVSVTNGGRIGASMSSPASLSTILEFVVHEVVKS